MLIPSETHQALDDTVNRLTGESILAQPGRDDGLVPVYSLLGELREMCSTSPALRGPVAAVLAEFEHHLDNAAPFDDALLLRLRGLVAWLPAAITSVKAGTEIAPLAGGPVPPAGNAVAPAAAPEPAVSAGVLLSLNLDENRELLTEFFSEAVDHLTQIEAALLALDQNPEDPEALNAIFRSFHTIKGNAGFLGLVPMQTLAHEVESLLDLARNHRLRLSSLIITEILRSRDALQTLTQQIGRALEHGVAPEQIVPVEHLIAAVRKLASGAGSVVSSAPAPAAAPASVPAPELLFAAAPSRPVPAEKGADSVPTGHPAKGDGAPPPSAAPVTAAPAARAVAATVRVNTEKLDSLMNVVGELVIVQSQLLANSREGATSDGTPLQRNVAQLSRLTKELQNTAMSLRMIPIKATFQKMERVVRDLARDFDKKVNFTTSGDDTELDRTVVEEIGDPLVHMVRNALDHGLEPTAERTAKGKPEAGSVQLRAYHQGSNIVIELTDDGRGIDPERIMKKAIEKGVIPAGAALAREEIFALIFAPGFSTAEKVTAVSGRGVGMDVVKRNIEKLRGKIEIESEVGRGSTFKIKLPLTMAIIDGLVVRVGAEKFILPSMSVQMALRPERANISTVQGQGEVLDLRGRYLPLHRLHRCFGIPADAQNPWDGIVVVIEASGCTSALLVDEMISKQEVVIKNLGALMQGRPGVSGGAILGDGTIALILDPSALPEAA